VGKAKAGTLKPAEYNSGTFMVSNLGMMGVSGVCTCPLSAGAASSRHQAKMSTLACSKDLKISSHLDFFSRILG